MLGTTPHPVNLLPRQETTGATQVIFRTQFDERTKLRGIKKTPARATGDVPTLAPRKACSQEQPPHANDAVAKAWDHRVGFTRMRSGVPLGVGERDPGSHTRWEPPGAGGSQRPRQEQTQDRQARGWQRAGSNHRSTMDRSARSVRPVAPWPLNSSVPPLASWDRQSWPRPLAGAVCDPVRLEWPPTMRRRPRFDPGG
jgi:hypothetical protein